MQFTIDRDALQRAVKLARIAVPTRTSLPILTHFYLDATPDGALIVAASDLQVSVVATAGAVVGQPGRATAPAQLLGSMIDKCPAPRLSVALEKSRLRITGESAKLALPSLEAEDFPESALADDAAPVAECDAKDLREALGRVAFASALDDARPALACCYLVFEGDALTISAADGFRLAVTRLAVARRDDGERRTFLIPAKRLAQIAGLLPDGPLAIGATQSRNGESGIALSTATVRARCRATDAAFPDYRQHVPAEYATVATVHRAALMDAAALAGLAAEGGIGSTNNARVTFDYLGLDFATDRVTLRGEETAEAEVAVPLAAPLDAPVRLACDVTFLRQALGAFDSETVELRNDGPQGKIVVAEPGGPKGGHDATLQLIMTMQVRARAGA